MPVRINSDASMDVSGAVGITTHMGDALDFGYFHFLLVSLLSIATTISLETTLLLSMESLAALSKSWNRRDTCRSYLSN